MGFVFTQLDHMGMLKEQAEKRVRENTNMCSDYMCIQTQYDIIHTCTDVHLSILMYSLCAFRCTCTCIFMSIPLYMYKCS